MQNTSLCRALREFVYFAYVHHRNVEVQDVCLAIPSVCKRYTGIKLYSRSESGLCLVIYGELTKVTNSTRSNESRNEGVSCAANRE